MRTIYRILLSVAVIVSTSLAVSAGPSTARPPVDPKVAPDAICGYVGADVGWPAYDYTHGWWYQTFAGWIGNCGYANIYMHGQYYAYDQNGNVINSDRWPDSGDHICSGASGCSSPSISVIIPDIGRHNRGCVTFYFFVDTGPTEEWRSAWDCQGEPTIANP